MHIITKKNSLKKYNFNDHILGNIELWNANNVFNDINKNKKRKINIYLLNYNFIILNEYFKYIFFIKSN